MAYVVTVDWEGASTEDYDRVCELGNVGPATNPDEGIIAHLASVDDWGLHVVDVWESPEQFQTFVENRLGPAIAGAGLGDRPQPAVTIREIHKAQLFQPAAVAV
jgi:hypothetical protein